MELILMLIIAGLLGYWLAGSRFSKPIEDSAGKVADVSRDTAEKTSGWFRRLFRRKEKGPAVIEGTAVDAPAATDDPAVIPPAEKQPSRRKSEETE
jgi:hypothetical protein